MTFQDLLVGSLTEIRAARAGDSVAPEQMALALQLLNEYFDELNADKRALYSVQFQTFTLTPGLQPHTIGLSTNTPTPTFSVSVARPAKINWANLVIAGNIRIPFNLIDREQWANIRAGAAAGQATTITSSVPRQLYYEPKWPNGEIYLWPVENTAYGLELETATLLASVALTDTFSLPMGYQALLRLTMAEILAPSFGQQVSPSTAQRAMEARARAWGNNARNPKLRTWDAGMPSRAYGGRFNYLTGAVGDDGTIN